MLTTENYFIDHILDSFQKELGKDFDRYKNHAYRVYNFSLLLGGDRLDEPDKEKISIAAAFHDLAIWTHRTFDYLQPSADLADAYLMDNGNPEWIAEVSTIIHHHHKITPYSGAYENMVELFRKADWADVTLGLHAFGLKREQLKQIQFLFPDLGFHAFLIRKGLENFVRHPLNPLPMFKK